ncbi:MAG TPA: V-type ATPase subunit [Kofleriaceae bacterium]|nr:V-type ATPase subunit [Kofleriaceae bacterium]
MSAVAARARGMLATVVAGDALAAIDHARDSVELAAALARARLGVSGSLDAGAIDRLVSDRIAGDLAVLGRWTDALAPLELDEDRRTLRGFVRGLAAGAPTAQRLLAAIPTARLPARELAALAAATTVEQLALELARCGHPLAPALAGARMPVDSFAVELRLAHCFAERARSPDRALAMYLAQLIDAENAGAALLIAARGGGVDVAHAFIPGGRAIDRQAFSRAVAGSLDTARTRLAVALSGTPLAAALFQPAVAALEDAALVWQLQTQARLRRIEPLGLAPAIYTVLRRRDEARHLRRAAWRVAMETA